MASNFKKNGTDLDNIFEPLGTETKRADVGFQVGGTDISNRFYPLTAGGSAPAATGFKAGGTDLASLFAGIGTVTYNIPLAPRLVAIGTDGGVQTMEWATNTFTTRSSGLGAGHTGHEVFWNGTYFFAAYVDSANTALRILRSADGITWSQVMMQTGSWINSNNGKINIVGDTSGWITVMSRFTGIRFWYSTNHGTNWTTGSVYTGLTNTYYAGCDPVNKTLFVIKPSSGYDSGTGVYFSNGLIYKFDHTGATLASVTTLSNGIYGFSSELHVAQNAIYVCGKANANDSGNAGFKFNADTFARTTQYPTTLTTKHAYDEVNGQILTYAINTNGLYYAVGTTPTNPTLFFNGADNFNGIRGKFRQGRIAVPVYNITSPYPTSRIWYSSNNGGAWSEIVAANNYGNGTKYAGFKAVGF